MSSPLDRPYRASGDAIRYFRLQAGWTQEQLAHESGLHPTVISPLEKGRRAPKPKSVRGLAKAFGIERWKLVAVEEMVEDGLLELPDEPP
jgi:transcriptional regulator with XRE-family HTH domain